MSPARSVTVMSSVFDFPPDQRPTTPTGPLEPGTRSQLLKHGVNEAPVTDSGRSASTSLLTLDKLGHTISAPSVRCFKLYWNTPSVSPAHSLAILPLYSVASGSSTMTAPGPQPPFPTQRASTPSQSTSYQKYAIQTTRSLNLSSIVFLAILSCHSAALWGQRYLPHMRPSVRHTSVTQRTDYPHPQPRIAAQTLTYTR